MTAYSQKVSQVGAPEGVCIERLIRQDDPSREKAPDSATECASVSYSCALMMSPRPDAERDGAA